MDYLSEAKAGLTLQDLMNGTSKVLPTAVHSGRNDISFSMMKVTPMVGTKALQITCQSKSSTSDSAYTTRITLYDVEEGKRPSFNKNPCRVACGCQAYYFYFAYPNHMADAHLGPKPKPYTPVPNPKRVMPPKNPQNVPGACKHIFALALALSNGDVID